MRCVLAIALLLAGAVAPMPIAAANGVVLESVQGVAADDGSVAFRLTFNGPAPEASVIRSGERSVHVVLARTSRGPEVPRIIGKIGTVTQISVARFAAVGLRLDIDLVRAVKLRIEEEGNVLIVHVPSVKGDEEAVFEATAKRREAEQASLPPSAIRTVVVPLSFAEVSEVAGLLVQGGVVSSGDTFTAQSPFSTPPPTQSMSSSSYGSASQNAPPSYVTIPTGQLLPKDTPEGVRFNDHVAVDRRLNAVVLTGDAEQVAAYRRLIAEVDVPTRSVLLETQIVELTQTGARNLGLDFSPNGELATATFNTGTGYHPNASAAFRASLYAAQDDGNAKVLAEPRILSLDGQQAAILSGEAVPIFNTVTLQGGGSSTLQTQVQYINVGVSLQILPRIADDGRVTAHIFAEVSTIFGYKQNTPEIAVRQELTSAIVTDGDSLVIGGLLQQNDITNLSKIPGIGDIPILGQLFRDSSTSSQDTNLYVVITPHVISNRIVPPTIRPAKSH